VDAIELRRAIAAKPLASHATDDLERWAGAFRGELLEGLDLHDFDEYQAWCVAEREQARTLRTAVLTELVRRLADEPERAVSHARACVAIDPLDDAARAALVRLLGRLGHRDEARQHYEAGRRLEKELARPPSEDRVAAWRSVDERTKTSPAQAQAEGPAPSEDAPQPPLSRVAPLVGRARELAALQALGARAERDRRLATVVVSGEPGIGNTRLLQEWTQRVRAAGGAAVYGAAFEAESGHPYGPWLDALGEGSGRVISSPRCSAASALAASASSRASPRRSATSRRAIGCSWSSWTTCSGSTRRRPSSFIGPRARIATSASSSRSRHAKGRSRTTRRSCACCAA
jgi:hypothetical protein